MKIVGLITEYNPFHNGHLYHMKEAVRTAGADAVVAVMSGKGGYVWKTKMREKDIRMKMKNGKS